MRFIVTGGCGFIGSTLVESLIGENHTVVIFDDLSTGNKDNIAGLDIEFINGPYGRMSELAPDMDAIFHLGIPSSSPMYKSNPILVGEAINDSIEIFEYAKTNSCKVVFASSSSVYNGNRVPYREDMPVLVTDYYTECRYAIERLAKLYNVLYDVESVGIRFFSVYGPKEKYKKQYANMISQFLWSMERNEPPIIFGDGSQTRDFIHVIDIVEALTLAMKKDFRFEIFNAGTGTAFSFNDIVNLLNRFLGKKIKPIYKPNPIKNYVQDTLAETTKSAEVLGFRAKVGLEEGIESLIRERE